MTRAERPVLKVFQSRPPSLCMYVYIRNGGPQGQIILKMGVNKGERNVHTDEYLLVYVVHLSVREGKT